MSLLYQTNLTARSESTVRSPTSQLIRFVQTIRKSITPQVVGNALGVTTAAERIRRTLMAKTAFFIAVVPAVVLVVTQQALTDAVPIATFEGTFVASMLLAVLGLLVRLVQTVVNAIADPILEDAFAVVTPIFVVPAGALFLVRSIDAVVVAVADEVRADTHVVALALELIRLAAHIAIVFIAMIGTVELPVAPPDASDAVAISAAKFRLRTVPHQAVDLVRIVLAIVLVITLPPAGNTFGIVTPEVAGLTCDHIRRFAVLLLVFSLRAIVLAITTP